MNLNIKNKAVIINLDNIGIVKRFNNEGAISVVKSKKNHQNIIHDQALRLNAYINIREDNTVDNDKDFLQSYYDDKYLADDFTIINVGTKNTLGIKNNSYKNDVLCFDEDTETIERRLNFKSINIVYPEPSFSTTTKPNNKTPQEHIQCTIEQVIDYILFYFSKKSVLKNGQIIFLGNRLNLSL